MMIIIQDVEYKVIIIILSRHAPHIARLRAA